MTVTDELPPPDDPPQGVARIWGELDDGRELEDVLVEESEVWRQRVDMLPEGSEGNPFHASA